MASVNIIRHKPIPIFCSTAEVVMTYDDDQVVRLVEPSGNVGTQYPNELGSEWFGTIENLSLGLARGGANWAMCTKPMSCGRRHLIAVTTGGISRCV